MLYLIDANSIIDAKDKYYVIDRVPQYWEWLLHHANANRLKMPLENFEEVSPGADRNDPFHIWRKDPATAKALVLAEEVDRQILQRVLDLGYGTELTDDELETIGADPFLIAYALADTSRVVVTSEVSAPSKRRQNRKVPDVCLQFSVRCINPFELNSLLDFKTNWKPE